jgi:hypothetical protein
MGKQPMILQRCPGFDDLVKESASPSAMALPES